MRLMKLMGTEIRRLASCRWILYVSRRFAAVDRNGRSAETSFLSRLGICFGVMTLIAVVSVMNGFQMSYVDAIMEISSYHVRVSGLPPEREADFLAYCESQRNIVSAAPFFESQGLITGPVSGESAAVIRAVESDVMERDPGFAREVVMVAGSFDLSGDDSIVLGVYLARALGVRAGSRVNLLALSGGGDVPLLSRDREFTVTGIFKCGYVDISESYAFVSAAAAEKYFGKSAEKLYGVKLRRYEGDTAAIAGIRAAFPQARAESWRSYNRTFFGALRVEKNILMAVVFLIFIVAGVNIYNGMRRLVYERRQEISVLSAFGGTRGGIRLIFVLRGLSCGLAGSAAGVALGLLVSANMGHIFMAASRAMYCAQVLAAKIFAPETAAFIRENPMYRVYASIPARVVFPEVLAIALFGIIAPLAASLYASGKILDMPVSEVLHDE